MVHMSLQSLASTALNGANWMICNQFVLIIVQSSMAIKFITLADLANSKFSFFKFVNLLKICIVIFQIYGSLERR